MANSETTLVNEIRRGRLKPLVSIAVILFVIAALYFVVSAMPTDVLGEARPRAIIWWTLPLIGFLQIVFLFLVAEIWRRLVRVLTGTELSLWSAYLQLAISSVGKYVPGKVWGFVARAGEMHRQKIPIHLSVMSSVVEQILVVTGALLVAVVAALVIFSDYRFAVIAIGAALLVAAIIVSIKVPALTQWIMRRKQVENIPAEIPGYHAKSVFGFSLAYAVLWLLSGAIFSIIYFSLFYVPASAESVAALVLSNTVGIVAGFVAVFAPGGIGVREGMTTFVLAEFVPIREALMAAVSYRAWVTLIDGANAILVLVRETRLAKRAGRSQESNDAQ